MDIKTGKKNDVVYRGTSIELFDNWSRNGTYGNTRHFYASRDWIIALFGHALGEAAEHRDRIEPFENDYRRAGVSMPSFTPTLLRIDLEGVRFEEDYRFGISIRQNVPSSHVIAYHQDTPEVKHSIDEFINERLMSEPKCVQRYFIQHLSKINPSFQTRYHDILESIERKI